MSFQSIFCDIQEKIKEESVKVISEKYGSLQTDEERIRFTYGTFANELKRLKLNRVGKSSEKSRELRETGNVHFRKNDLWKAVKFYTESIARAPSDSEELCLAYGNRASCLLRLDLVQEALVDVERALESAANDDLKKKNLVRKEKCLNNMERTRMILQDPVPVQLPSCNPFFSSASFNVLMIADKNFGRSLMVRDDLKTGEILVVEKPFSSIVVPKHLYTHCSYCFKRSFNLAPCTRCPTAMYCSNECLVRNEEKHKIECQIMEILIELQGTTMELLSVKILTDASDQGKRLDKLWRKISSIKYKQTEFVKYNSEDHINIYNFVGNTTKRSNSDLFQKSVTACIILTILEKFTNFFDACSIKERHNLLIFAGGLLLRYLQSMPCNAHEISEYLDNEYEGIGAGAYATLSLINHSCDPNVVRHCYNDVIVLRTVRPIRKGEQLFDNYGYHYAVHELHERQTSLLKQYYFKCECDGCIKRWPQQHELPDNHPVFKSTIDNKKYDLLTESFKKNIEAIFNGENEECVLRELMEYLDFLDAFVERPWKAYNICQEAIKHCLGLQGNCFRLSKGIQSVTQTQL